MLYAKIENMKRKGRPKKKKRKEEKRKERKRKEERKKNEYPRGVLLKSPFRFDLYSGLKLDQH